MEICTDDDTYVRDLVRWVVQLSNGLTVYQDDDRPGIQEPSAWIRLKAYCHDQGVSIIEMWLQFRSNRVWIGPNNADGYYFVKSAFGVYGSSDTYHAYVAGTVSQEENQIKAGRWSVPALQFLEQQNREIDPDSPAVIMKNG